MRVKTALNKVRWLARPLSVIDGLTRALGAVTMVMTAALVAVMSYEMVVRRGFNAPTLWAFDISYMLSGMIFVMAVPYALLHSEHVRIDFLSSRMPLRLQHAVNLLFYAGLFLPCIYMIATTAVGAAAKAYVTGEVERVSPWSPLIWPYYAGLATGLCALVLQTVAQMIRHATELLTPAGRASLAAAELPAFAAKQG
jgi:TRAP-type mannitol/chloroaromatic compound transport system permease small subunit